MIQKISIANYKSIQSLKGFELEPVNILIGANNSGKSNFLDVFAFLRDSLVAENNQAIQGKHMGYLQGALQKRGGGETICFNDATSFQIKIESLPFRYLLDIAFQTLHYPNETIHQEQLWRVGSEQTFFEREDGKIIFFDERGEKAGSTTGQQQTGLAEMLRRNQGDVQALDFARKLSDIRIYDRIHTEMWSPIRTPQVSRGDTILDEDGGNLVSVLHQLSQTNRVFQQQLDSLLRVLFRDFSSISFPSNHRGELMIRWEDSSGRISNISQLSDGTLKFLCMVAILKNPNSPALVGINELDAKLHPRMQEVLADMIREASKRTQILGTTHNPDFISLFNPREIVVLQRYHGAAEMRRFSDKGALKSWLQDFTTRELWLMGELESRW